MKKILQLEGVRGIGALIVFTCHFQLVFFPRFYLLIADFLKQIVSLRISNYSIGLIDLEITGNMFLHVFWALSAYVIFRKFFEFGSGGENLIAASVKRYLRLMLPCGAAVLGSYFLYRAGLIYINTIYVNGLHVHTRQVNLYTISPSFIHALKSSVWNNLFDYDYANSYNGPLWTIEKEFYGSLFCFGLFGVVGQVKNRSVFYLVLFSCIYLLKYYWLNSFLIGYFLSDFDFTLPRRNGLIYQYASKINEFILGNQLFSVLVFVVIFLGSKYILLKHPYRLDAVNCILSFLVILLSLRVRVFASMMKFRPIAVLGRLSFGVYVLHWPIMCSFSAWCYLNFSHDSYLNLLFLYLETLTLTLVLAAFFHIWIDRRSVIFAGKVSRYISGITQGEMTY